MAAGSPYERSRISGPRNDLCGRPRPVTSPPQRFAGRGLRYWCKVCGFEESTLLQANRVDLRSEGSVTGDVAAQRITIEDGAFFEGGIHIGKPRQQKDGDGRAEISRPSARHHRGWEGLLAVSARRVRLPHQLLTREA
jgi:hypothetical protein